MDISKLKTTLAPGEPFVDDQAALAWVNTTVTTQADATNGDVLSWCAAYDIIHKLEVDSAGADSAKRGLADAALARVRAGLGLSLTDPVIQGMLSAMVASGQLTQAEVDALNAGSTTEQTRAAAAGLGKVHLFEVTEARAL